MSLLQWVWVLGFAAMGCRVDEIPSLVPVNNGSNFHKDGFSGPLELGGSMEVGSSAVAMPIPPKTSLTGFGGFARRPWLPLISGLSKGAGFCLPSKGVDDLSKPQVKALLIKNNQHHALILSADVVAVTAEMTEKTLSMIKEKKPFWNLSHTSFQLVATHTHSGPAGLTHHPLWGALGCDSFYSQMAESFYNTALGATLKAHANLKTVSSFRVRYGTIEGANRSRISNLKVDKNYFKLDFFSDTRRVGCFQIFSMHPTHLGMSNSLLSADLVGHIENASVLDGSPCLFFNGTVGNAEAHNVGEPEAYGKDIWKKGNLLNEDVLPPQFTLISMPISLPNPRLNIKACGIPSVLSKTTHFGILKTLPRQTKISTFNFGHFTLAFIPGEPTYDLWDFLNQNHSSRKLIFVSLANDYLGYLSTHTVYNTKALESCSNLYGPNIQWTLQDNFKSIALD